MIAEKRIKIDIDKQLDAMYINLIDAHYDSNTDITTEEISLGVYRVYDENRPYATFRYVILDLSYQDMSKISEMVNIQNLKEFIK